MRQKMAIFKEGNSVCSGTFFQELSFYIQKEMNSWGRCVRKWRFSNRETAFAGSNVFDDNDDDDDDILLRMMMFLF